MPFHATPCHSTPLDATRRQSPLHAIPRHPAPLDATSTGMEWHGVALVAKWHGVAWSGMFRMIPDCTSPVLMPSWLVTATCCYSFSRHPGARAKLTSVNTTTSETFPKPHDQRAPGSNPLKSSVLIIWQACVQCCAGALERVCLSFGRLVCSAERVLLSFGRRVCSAERVL